jgi:hypothetical protein
MRLSLRHRRRASAYFLVLASACIVAMAGLTALTLQRVRLRTSRQDAALAQARFYAQSAVDIGLAWIAQDPDWRTNRPSGVWASDKPIGNGTFSVEGVDPGDDNLKDGTSDPLVLTGTGVSGPARYKLQVTLTGGAGPLTCLEVSLHAGSDIVFNEPTQVSGDQIISSNNMIMAVSTATVSPDMEAVNGFSGTLGPGSTSDLTEPRTLPDPATVFDDYLSNGTYISWASLPTLDASTSKLERVVLSPNSNPFGTTNPEGIYIIDCQGKSLQIGTCRILGTLVLINVGAATGVYEPIFWETALSNYPALLVSGTFTFNTPDSQLSESSASVNFNPPGTPYQGFEDIDLADTYPSVINGLVYVSGDAQDTSSPSRIAVNGVWVVGNTLTITPSSTKNYVYLDLTYDPKFHENPPPGFGGDALMKISAGTWRQVVD